MNNKLFMPCTEWSERLAARHPEDISPADRIALNNHIASCESCAAVHAAYRAMEINVRALPATSLPGLPHERLRQREKSVMPSMSSLLAYFGLFSRGESRTTALLLPVRRPTYIKQSLFYLAIVACLSLIFIVGVLELSVSPRQMTSHSSPNISAPTTFAVNT